MLSVSDLNVGGRTPQRVVSQPAPTTSYAPYKPLGIGGRIGSTIDHTPVLGGLKQAGLAGLDFVGKALSVPSQLTEKLLTGGSTYEQRYGLPSWAGTVARMALDPLNFVSFGGAGVAKLGLKGLETAVPKEIGKLGTEKLAQMGGREGAISLTKTAGKDLSGLEKTFGRQAAEQQMYKRVLDNPTLVAKSGIHVGVPMTSMQKTFAMPDLASKINPIAQKVASKIPQPVLQGASNIAEKTRQAVEYPLYRAPKAAEHIVDISNVGKQKYFEMADKLAAAYSKAPPEVRTLADQVLEGTSHLTDHANPVIKQAIEARKTIDDLGAQAVKLGLLDAKVYNKGKGNYLPQLYDVFIQHAGDAAIGGTPQAKKIAQEEASRMFVRTEEQLKSDLEAGKITKDVYDAEVNKFKLFQQAGGMVGNPAYRASKALQNVGGLVEKTKEFKGLRQFAPKDGELVDQFLKGNVKPKIPVGTKLSTPNVEGVKGLMKQELATKIQGIEKGIAEKSNEASKKINEVRQSVDARYARGADKKAAGLLLPVNKPLIDTTTISKNTNEIKKLAEKQFGDNAPSGEVAGLLPAPSGAGPYRKAATIQKPRGEGFVFSSKEQARLAEENARLSKGADITYKKPTLVQKPMGDNFIFPTRQETKTAVQGARLNRQAEKLGTKLQDTTTYANEYAKDYGTSEKLQGLDRTEFDRFTQGELLDARARGQKITIQEAQTKAAERMVASSTEVNYKGEKLIKLPENKALGALSGVHVPEGIYTYLTDGAGKTLSAIQGNLLLRLVTNPLGFKAAKTIYSPGSQVRNILSNQILNFLQDPGSFKFFKQSFDAVRNPNSPLFKEMEAAGVFSGKFFGQEVGKLYNKIDNLSKLDNLSLFDKVMGRVADVHNAAGNLRDFSENMAKAQAYIRARELGADVMQAKDVAEATIFAYNKVGPAVRIARATGVPFLTFTIKAVPFIAKQALKHPARLAVFPKAEQGAMNIMGVNPEEMKYLPDYMQGMIPIGKDKDGNSIYFNPKYIYPWGQVMGGDVQPLPGLPFIGKGGSLPGGISLNPTLTELASQLTGRDLFTGQEFVRASQTTGDQVRARAEHLAKTVLPGPAAQAIPFLPGATSTTSAQKSRGAVRTIRDSLTGLNTYTFNQGQQLQNNRKTAEAIRRETTTEVNKAIKSGASPEKIAQIRQQGLQRIKDLYNQ